MPHRASLSIGIQQSDATIYATLAQAAAADEIQYASSGYNQALASRKDVRPVFSKLFAESRQVADELLKGVPPGERITLDPKHPRIQGLARQLLAAAWLANPSHPGHRQVSELRTDLKK